MRRPRTPGRLFVISSPSGGGKTTVGERLRQQQPRLVRSVSVTTRPPRPGERDGRDYQFVSLGTFRRLRRSGALLEWAKVHGAYYGTPKRSIERALAAGHDAILSIDVQGARQIRRRFGRRAVLIFLRPPSMEQLRRRLMRRRTETAAVIRRRLAAAKRELACRTWYDHTVVNDRFQRTIARMQRILTSPRHDNERGTTHGTSTD